MDETALYMIVTFGSIFILLVPILLWAEFKKKRGRNKKRSRLEP